jgi:hypothetical protein
MRREAESATDKALSEAVKCEGARVNDILGEVVDRKVNEKSIVKHRYEIETAVKGGWVS